MITTIIFDMAGVLFKDVFPTLAEKMSEMSGKTEEDINKIRHDNWQPFKLGTVTEEEFCKSVMKDLEVDENRWKELSDAARAGMQPIEETIEVVKKLRATKKYKLAILSNNSVEWATQVIKKSGIRELFDDIILSCNLEMKKPDMEIYMQSLVELHVEAVECIFIDDKERNTKPATELGMNTIVFKSSKQVEDALRALGVKF